MFINDMVRFVYLKELGSEMDQLAELFEKLLVEGDDEKPRPGKCLVPAFDGLGRE